MATEAESLGHRLRSARLRRGFSQQELAERVGLSIESISRAERGVITPTIWTLKAFARALGLGLADLVDGPARVPPSRSECLEELRRLDDLTLAALVDLVRALRGDGVRPGRGRVSPR